MSEQLDEKNLNSCGKEFSNMKRKMALEKANKPLLIK